ncbi:unnamed protein product [Rotaria sordida]|uniref:Thymidylate kinase-like domain-containing protein n=1 Tax=Rotaria sordida TaxID=392033 RepID=A0A815B9D1_9BILA|nr:unnamed protein product [Rotaria sordida]CAF1267116.1 unnamed protein product [Rotaria sordida]
MATKRGALIIFEGLDRIAFPNRSTEIGSLIDNYLQRKIEFNDHTIHLLFSANRWECIDTMRTKLLQGYTLIVDRYAYSGIAFTQAKGLDKNWCQSCDIGLLKPDLVLYFHRNKQTNSLSYTGDERYETKSFQDKVEFYFEQLRLSSSEQWQDINVLDNDNKNMRDKESIQNEIRLYVKDCINGIKNNHIDELWKHN